MSILKKVRSPPNSVFDIHNPLGLKFLSRLRMPFSHLKEHKFKHNFQDNLDQFCNCRLYTKTTVHFFLCCFNLIHQCQTLLDSLLQIDHDILKLNESLLTDTMLFGNSEHRASINDFYFFYFFHFLFTLDN